jgi:molybdopterin/thiamine biosynthesis adenylyltransferase/rhodanese-related sulfurtransferase
MTRKAPNSFETTVRDAFRDLESGIELIDIRTENELGTGMPAGAVAMTAAEVMARCVSAPGRRVNLICGGGARSLVLAATLSRQGVEGILSVAGGVDRWRAAGLPMDRRNATGQESNERYARHIVMPQVGPEGQARLLDSRVMLAGLGGLNSPVALYLAAAGVGTIGLADHDTVERSNLQRQVLHGETSVGQSKVQSARRRLQELNPDVRTEAIEERIDANNAARLVKGWDVVIDGMDNFPARYALNEACVKAGIPLVYGAVMRFQGQVSVFWPAAGQGKTPCLQCLLPESTTVKAPPSCAEAGVLGVMPGIIGTLQATEALKLLLGTGESLIGQLLMIDALTMDFRKARIQASPACPVCG